VPAVAFAVNVFPRPPAPAYDPHMPEILLHQYDTSPFSEKVRKLLALKRVP
jgi:hypothetical protein